MTTKNNVPNSQAPTYRLLLCIQAASAKTAFSITFLLSGTLQETFFKSYFYFYRASRNN